MAPGTEGLTGFDVSRAMRARGWHLPAYTFPAPCQDVSVLRVVVRTGFTAELAGMFVADLTEVTRRLHTDRLSPPVSQRGARVPARRGRGRSARRR